MKLSSGPTYRELYDSAVASADMAIGIGFDAPAASFFGTVTGTFGVTAEGFATRQVMLGVCVELVANQFRFGFAQAVGYTMVERRATGNECFVVSERAAPGSRGALPRPLWCGEQPVARAGCSREARSNPRHQLAGRPDLSCARRVRRSRQVHVHVRRRCGGRERRLRLHGDDEVADQRRLAVVTLERSAARSTKKAARAATKRRAKT